MNRMTAALLGTSMISALAVAGAFAHEKDAKAPAGQADRHAGHSAGSMELHRSMMQGHQAPMPMSGDVDKDFATMMTRHHQQAIRMSDVLLKHGTSAELKALARKMQQSQREEIKQMAPYTR